MVRLWNALRRDWLGLRSREAIAAPISTGLHTYRFTPRGGTVRIHLRVESNGSGVLFVDVTDVVHLNPTAVRMAKMALDGIPRDSAITAFSLGRRRQEREQITNDVNGMYAMVERFSARAAECPTCAVENVGRAEWFSTEVRAPFKADLAITYKCNNDCPHCYNEADRLTLEAMPLEDWKQVIDRLCHVGVPHLIFTGGEATPYGDLPQLIAYAESRGPICGLNSNGRRFADAEYARTMARAGLNHLQVTLGSHRADVHDRMMNARCFDQTVRGIRNAMDAGIHTITNTTLMQMNKDEIESTLEFLHDLGIRTFAINGMIYSGGGFDTGQAIPEEQMPAILIRIRDRARELGMKFLWYTPTQYCRLSPVELDIGAKRCNAGEYSLCVEPNGDVLPCQSFYVAAGNLLRDPWDQIWNGALFRSFRERQDDPKKHGLPEKCWECPDLPLCGGGCRIEREAADGVRSAAGGCGSGGCSGCATSGCGTGSSQLGFVEIESLTGPGLLPPPPSSTPLLPILAAPEPLAGRGRRGTGMFS